MEVVTTLGQTLIAKGQSITSVESLTAGMFASELAGVPGISAVFPGALVTYANEMKSALAGVDPAIIATQGVVSAPVAEAMATGGQARLETDWAIAFTGAAGPSALEGQPAGTVFIGIATPTGIVLSRRYQFAGDRMAVRQASVQAGATWLLELSREV